MVVSGNSFVNMGNIKENKEPTLIKYIVKSEIKMTGSAIQLNIICNMALVKNISLLILYK